jgi:hypothetical protein
VSENNVGPSRCSAAQAHAIAVSMPSAGRQTASPGIARSASSCSMGWWVGPSSPRKTESWVKTKRVGTFIKAASRIGGRM